MTNIAHYIDHTLLRPDATESDIFKLCEEANECGFKSVCVAPCWETIAGPLLKKPEVDLCIVKNFPHGNSLDLNGMGIFMADEIDFVANIGYIKSKMWKRFGHDIWSMRHMGGENKIIKVIVEVGYLTDEELFHIADLLIEHKIDFIKTCTGYGPRNVTIEDIVKIKKYVGDRIKIKASGGIKTYEFARQLIEAGADRLGCSNSINIVKESSNGGQGTGLGKDSASY